MAKKRYTDRKQWLEEKGNLADIDGKTRRNGFQENEGSKSDSQPLSEFVEKHTSIIRCMSLLIVCRLVTTCRKEGACYNVEYFLPIKTKEICKNCG